MKWLTKPILNQPIRQVFIELKTIWQSMPMKHTLERVAVNAGNKGTKIYYRSSAFWHASAKVNLPAVINTLYSSALNGFDQRCSAYGNCLAVLTEMKFPDATNNLTLEFPEGYDRREM